MSVRRGKQFLGHLVRRFLVPLSLSVAAIACASGPPDALKTQLARTDTSIEQAEQAGAATAGLPDLQMAKDKRARAQDELVHHHYDTAMQLAQQAQVDAQFASRKSQAELAMRSASELRRSNDALRAEANRNVAPPIATP